MRFIMKIVKVDGLDKDFKSLCEKLEEFQFGLMPVLRERGYELTSDLEKIVGYVLYIDDIAVGSVGLKHISEDTCEIVRVFVDENYRGRGYAGILFEKIENFAKEIGYKKVEMVAWSKAKSALRLYEKLGYNRSEEKSSEWFAGLGYVELFKKIQ